MNPVIVVAAYNRTNSLSRLLNSLDAAEYSHYDKKVKLIISIDNSGKNDVFELANKFVWKHGEKEIIHHSVNLGLKEHILRCGNLTNTHGNIILLEDDLFVSKHFYSFSVEAITYYKDDIKIAGISLYSHRYNETARLPFEPINENTDIYFMQLPSSWGQAWTSKQWNSFMNWYANFDGSLLYSKLPSNIQMWPASSWKKIYTLYMIRENKYFVYPRFSYSTNFGDTGTNQRNNNTFQVPLVIDGKINNFRSFSSTISKYDSFCEIIPESLKKFRPELDDYDFDVDLYGKKDLSNCKKYVLTSRNLLKSEIDGKEIIFSYGLRMKPIEMNIIENITGEKIRLIEIRPHVKTNNFLFDIDLVEFYYFKFNKVCIRILLSKLSKIIGDAINRFGSSEKRY